MGAADEVAQLADLVPANGRIAVGDGAGHPAELWSAVLALTAARPDISLLLGWFFRPPPGAADLSAARARTLISGFGLRRAIDAGLVGFLPVRMGTVPSLLAGPLRVDVLVTTLTPVPDGLAFTTEVSWQRAAIAAGASVVATVRPDAISCAAGQPIARGDVLVLAEGHGAPVELAAVEPTPEQHAVAARVADLVPEGARVQIGPGGLGAAIYAALRRPVAVDTGLVTDPVVDLHRRGLLDGVAYAPYLAGTEVLYDWAPGHAVVDGIEHTHSGGRLTGGRPLVAVNTGLEIDIDSAVNAEMVDGSWVGGIGGQPDYAAAAASSPRGLSIIAMTTRRRDVPTLVEQLQGPATTPGHDVDVVVTERGHADLRGLTRSERRAAMRSLWGLDAP